MVTLKLALGEAVDRAFAGRELTASRRATPVRGEEFAVGQR
jgi:hypothetical protein